MSQLMHEIAGTLRLCIATGFSVCVLWGGELLWYACLAEGAAERYANDYSTA